MRLALRTLFVLLAASSAAAQESSNPNRDIRAQIAKLQNAFNTQDAAGMTAIYAPDGDAMINDGAYAAGAAALLKAGRDDIASRPQGLQINITVTGVRLVTADVAIATTRAHFNLPEVKDDRGTFVFVRKDGKWLLTALRVQAAEKQ